MTGGPAAVILTFASLLALSHAAPGEPFQVKTWETRGPLVEPWRVIETGPHAGAWVVAGDLTGDGRAEIVAARNDNQAVTAAAAYNLEGEELWTWGEAGAGSPNWTYDVPLQLYDLNGDGRDEVFLSTPGYLVVLNGATGQELRRHPLPDGLEVADCITFADLAGVGRPTDIIVKTRYTKVWAFDRSWDPLWSWTPPEGYKTIHHPEPMDLDGDGRDEVLVGYTLLGPDGDERWTYTTEATDLRRGHLDCAELIHPGFGSADHKVEHARIAITCCGANLVAVLNGRGEAVWEVAGAHYESVDAGPIAALDPMRNPYQVVVDIDHVPWGEAEVRMFGADGSLAGTYLVNYGRHHRVIDWNGDGLMEVLLANARGIYDGDGQCLATFSPGSAHSDHFERVEHSEEAGRNSGPYAFVGDMDGDGVNDAVLYTQDGAWIYRSETAGTRDHRLGTGVNWTLY